MMCCWQEKLHNNSLFFGPSTDPRGTLVATAGDWPGMSLPLLLVSVLLFVCAGGHSLCSMLEEKPIKVSRMCFHGNHLFCAISDSIEYPPDCCSQRWSHATHLVFHARNIIYNLVWPRLCHKPRPLVITSSHLLNLCMGMMSCRHAHPGEVPHLPYPSWCQERVTGSKGWTSRAGRIDICNYVVALQYTIENAWPIGACVLCICDKFDAWFSFNQDPQFQFHSEGEEGCLHVLNQILALTQAQGAAGSKSKAGEGRGWIQVEEDGMGSRLHLMACL